MVKISWNTHTNISLQEEFYDQMYIKHPELLVYSRDQIKDMLTGFNNHTMEQVVSTKDGVLLPLYMGAMYLATYGKRENIVDKPTSKAIGKEVVYTNHHSDGYGGRIYYVTEVVKHRFKDGKFWGFVPDARVQRKVVQAYKTNWKKFVHVSSPVFAAKVFRKAKLKEFAMAKGQEVEKLYNEFDFD